MVDVVNALRPDVPVPSFPAEVILVSRSRAARGRLRSSQPGRVAGMSELIELTAAAAAERVRAGELDAGELFDAYRERAGADELNAFLWVATEAPAR